MNTPGIRRLAERFRERSTELRWRSWLKKEAKYRKEIRAKTEEILSTLTNQPLISIILPVYNVDEVWLRNCIESVRNQWYQKWELCVADDHSSAPHIRKVLDEYAAGDKRIKLVYRDQNGHISAASNTALSVATGEFSALLDHDDELSEDALFWLVCELNKFPATAFFYSDEDKIDQHGRRFFPTFKPDWSRDLMYSLNLGTHLSAYRTEILKEIAGFRVGLEGSQDYDLALRVIERIDENQIRHIPRILYHWRTVPGSVALDGGEKPYAHERARQAIREHFERTGVKATVAETHFNLHRVRYALPERLPVVSLIFWGGDVSADNSSIDGLTSDFDDKKIEILDANGPGELAHALNSSVMSSSGDVIVFLRSGVVPRSELPLDELVSMVLQPKIGAAGGLVIGQDGTVQAGGIVLDANDLTHVAHAGFPHDVQGNLLRNMVIGNFSAVCLDAFAIRKDVFLNAGAFDEKLVDKDLIAADLCLRLGRNGYRIALTPYVKFAEPKPASSRRQISSAQRDLFVSRWAEELKTDPFSNPNLTSDGLFSIKI